MNCCQRLFSSHKKSWTTLLFNMDAVLTRVYGSFGRMKHENITRCTPYFLDYRGYSSEERPRNLSKKQSKSSSTLKSKYEFFDESKPARIYDAQELEGFEDAQWETIEESEEIPRADEKFYGINLKRGENGIFDIEELVEILRNENLIDICVLKIPKQIQYCDFMVIATVKSGRQRAGIAEFIRQVSKRKKLPNDHFPIIEGTFKESWIAMDLGNIVLHMFDDETREHYDLETLWTVGPDFDDPRHSGASEYEQFLTQVNLNSKESFDLLPPAFTDNQNSPQKSRETS